MAKIYVAQGERRPLLRPLQVPPQQDAHRHKGPIFPLSLSLSISLSLSRFLLTLSINQSIAPLCLF